MSYIEWDSQNYSKHFSFVADYGRSLIDLIDGKDGLYDWIRMFVKNPFEGLSAAVSEEIIREAVDELRPTLCEDGVWYADYVRLRCKAVKPGISGIL